MILHHQYTCEVLYHFTCGVCENWWSYSITPFVQPFEVSLDDKPIYCPHCGYKQKAKIKDGYQLEKHPDYLAKSANKT
jgi:C4-type Zn-finger protein